MGNSQTDKLTKACLKILDPGGQKIQSRIAWILLVGNVLRPKQVNIAMERIYQEESHKSVQGPLILGWVGKIFQPRHALSQDELDIGSLKILDPGGQKYFNQKMSSDIPDELLVNFLEDPLHGRNPLK